jgi:hypothetical protein
MPHCQPYTLDVRKQKQQIRWQFGRELRNSEVAAYRPISHHHHPASSGLFWKFRSLPLCAHNTLFATYVEPFLQHGLPHLILSIV